MDNLPKEDNQQETSSQNSGEIFSNQEKSAYEEAIAPIPESTPVEAAYSEPQSPEINTENQDLASSSGSSLSEPPPPYIEDKGKKYLILGAIIIFFMVLIFLIFVFLRNMNSKKPVNNNSNITLTYWGLWEEEETMRLVIDDYQRLHQNISIKYTRQDPKQYRERLQAAIDRGEGPDIFRFHNTWVPMLLKFFSPLPKTVLSDTEFGKTFYPVVSYDLKIGENYYGIPLEIDGLLLYYNEDILKSANIPIPSTWIDIQDAVAKLTVKEKDKIVTSAIALGTAENIEHFSDILALMMLQNGTQLTKSLFSCTDSATTSCAVEALAFYRKFAETPNNTWDETLENSIVAFAGGKVAMILAPSWETLTIKQLNPSLNFKTAPVPQLPCQTNPCPAVNFATYWVEGVSNKSKNTDAAWEFLKYLSQADTMQKLYAEEVKLRKHFGEPYSRVDLGKLLVDNPYLAPLINSAATMKSFYSASRTFDGETGLNTGIINYMKDAVNSLSQGVSPETALKTADNGFKQVFARFGLTIPAK